MENKRIMALDVGRRRIGIAISDILGIIATPYGTYERKGFKTDIAYLKGLIEEKDVVKVICGLPISVSGLETEQSTFTRDFAENLQNEITVPLEFIDERYTTQTATEALIEFDVKRDKRKGLVDKVAASLILQNYLNVNKN